MGLISNLQSWVTQHVSTETRAKVVSAVDTTLTALTSPFQAIVDFKKAKEETSKKTPLKLVAEGVENVLAVTAPFTSAGKTLLVKAGQAAFKTLPRAATTLTAGAAILSSPTIRKTAVTALTPSTYIGAGEKIGQFVEKAPKEVKDAASKGVVLAGTGLGLFGAGVAAYNLLTGDEKPSPEKPSPEKPLPTNTATPESNLQAATIPTNTQTPKIPEVIEVKPSVKSKRRRKTKKKREVPYINIKIDNREDNDTYDRKVYKGRRY